MKQIIRTASLVTKVILVVICVLLGWLALSVPPAHAAETRVVSTKLGDFTVNQMQQLREGCPNTVLDDCWETVSQEIEGGRFIPPEQPARTLKPGLNLLVDTVGKKLQMYYLHDGGAVSPIQGWAVVTVQAEDLPADEVEGRVRAVDRDPSWCPTKSARLKYPELPPGCFGPGHELNAMGVAKMLIDWKVSARLHPSWVTRRIHGTGGYQAGDFLEDETLGCVRLLNDELLLLLTLANDGIKGARVLLYR